MTAEIERFISSANSDAALQKSIAKHRDDLDALIKLANDHGFRVSRADADAYIAAHSSELADRQLDHVAGGGHKKKGEPPIVYGIHNEYEQFYNMKYS